MVSNSATVDCPGHDSVSSNSDSRITGAVDD